MPRWRALTCASIGFLTFFAGSPAHAYASTSVSHDQLMQAKGADFGGPNAAPDLISESDTPVTGDGSGGGGVGNAGQPHHGIQVNDPALDNIQDFPGSAPNARPYELSIQSETSAASFGNNVLVGYNSSANQPLVLNPNGTRSFVHRFLSGYSVSHDAGRSWASGFIAPEPGSPFTSGDPSVGVDRAGSFYYASLSATKTGQSDIIVGKSTDGGDSFHPAVEVAKDPGSDKEWLAVGRDVALAGQDNLYVTWTSFNSTGSTLVFSKSTDGGQTWSAARTLFAPVDTGVMSSFIQFSNPVVDQSSGRLYIPFMHFSNGDVDTFRVLVSDDSGLTFRFLAFNVPGAVDPFAFPLVQPGTITDCGVNGGARLALTQGADDGFGASTGLPSFVHETRLVAQPMATAQNGRFFIAFNASTSPFFGDPSSGSEIKLLYSPNGGGSWQLSTVAGASAAEPRHVHPAVAVSRDGGQVTVAYYAQGANTKLRTELKTAQVGAGGVSFGDGTTHLSTWFDLIPSNIPVAQGPGIPAHFTTNYDRTIRPCYDIGEYMAATNLGDGVIAAWGDNRNPWTSPPDSPAAGTHPQPDVFAKTANSD